MPEVTLRNEFPGKVLQAATPPANAQQVEEVPAAAPVAAPEEAKDPRLEHLIKKERFLRNRDREFKAREESLRQKEEALKQQEAQYQTGYIPKNKLLESPLDVLNELGVSQDALTQALINQPNPTDLELRKVQATLRQLQQEQQQAKEMAVKQQEAQYSQAIGAITKDVKMLVQGQPQEFELIQQQQAHDAVVELIKHTFDTEGYVMDTETAAREVEEYLVESVFETAKLKKIQSRLNPPAAEPQAAPKAPVKTLTHQSILPTKSNSNRERRERAILAFQGKL